MNRLKQSFLRKSPSAGRYFLCPAYFSFASQYAEVTSDKYGISTGAGSIFTGMHEKKGVSSENTGVSNQCVAVDNRCAVVNNESDAVRCQCAGVSSRNTGASSLCVAVRCKNINVICQCVSARCNCAGASNQCGAVRCGNIKTKADIMEKNDFANPLGTLGANIVLRQWQTVARKVPVGQNVGRKKNTRRQPTSRQGRNIFCILRP